MTGDVETLTVGSLSALAMGRASDPLVLCLHGFPDVPSTYRALLPELAAQRFRAVAPWLRGYAPSTIEGPFDLDRLSADVFDLGNALSPDRPYCIVGHDWGAILTYWACARAPERIARAVTLAAPHPIAFVENTAPHPGQWVRSSYMALFQFERAEAIVRARNFAFIDRLFRIWSPGFEPPKDHLDEIKACLDASLPSPLEYYRAAFRPLSALRRRMREARSPARCIRVPTLYLHGDRDGCISVSMARGQSRYFEGTLIEETVPDAGHFLHLERPLDVNDRILRWLS